jgi:predicted dinucleotide-binding enzyme
VVLDATNPHEPMVAASGAEEVAVRAPGARVVKAFNTVAAPLVAQAAAAPGRLSLLYCGDQAAAKQLAGGLIVDAGFVPVDAGRLDAARDVEALGRLLVAWPMGRDPGRSATSCSRRRSCRPPVGEGLQAVASPPPAMGGLLVVCSAPS